MVKPDGMPNVKPPEWKKSWHTRPRNPPHPGVLVRDNLEDLGLSVVAGAIGLGSTRQQFYNVINGKSAITPEMAVRLEKAFGGSADAWLRRQANHDLALVRKRDKEITVTRLTARSA